MNLQENAAGKKEILVFAAICAALGLMPHLLIMYQVGPGTFYQGAWDEAFYLLTLHEEGTSWNDYPLKQLVRFCIEALNPELRTTALVFDGLLPFAIVLSAGVLARRLVVSPIAIIAVCFLLAFGTDILSLNSSVTFLSKFSLSYWLREWSIFERQFFLDAYATFLGIYRTPEPQLSLPFFYLHLAALISFISMPKNLVRTTIPLLFTSLACTAIYSFFSLAALAFNLAAFIALLIGGERQKLRSMGLILGLSIAGTVAVLMLYYSTESSAALFQSRLPEISTGMIYGVIGVLLVLLKKRSRALNDSRLLFSLALLMFPLFALNQQVVTGWMVQALNWERYINIPVVIVALLFAFSTGGSGRGIQEQEGRLPVRALALYRSKAPALWAGSVLVVFTAFVFHAQLKTFQQWQQYNVQTQTYALALDRALQTTKTAPASVFLDQMQADAAVLARTSARGFDLKGYSWIVTTGFGSRSTPDSPHSKEHQGFVLAARLGMDASAYEAALEKEVSGTYCWPHMMYLADFLECAPYTSDFRKYDQEKLREISKRGVESYRAFLSDELGSIEADAIVLTATPLDPANGKWPWLDELLFETEIKTSANWLLPAASAKVYAYRQTRK